MIPLLVPRKLVGIGYGVLLSLLNGSEGLVAFVVGKILTASTNKLEGFSVLNKVMGILSLIATASAVFAVIINYKSNKKNNFNINDKKV